MNYLKFKDILKFVISVFNNVKISETMRILFSSLHALEFKLFLIEFQKEEEPVILSSKNVMSLTFD